MPAALIRERVQRQFREAMQTSASFRRFVQIALILGGVLMAGVSEALSNVLAGNPKVAAQTLWFVGLFAAFLGGLVVAYFEQGTAEALESARAALHEVDLKEEELRERVRALQQASHHSHWLARIYALSLAQRESIEQVATEGHGGPEALRTRMGSMLDLLVADKATFFGMGDEAWNFAIYIWMEDIQALECIACRRPALLDALAPHRSWKSGEGHVGMAFQRKREFIEADLTEPEKAKFFSVDPENLREHDAQRYRSIASLPLMVGTAPVGVLVATSDVPGRFNPKESEEVLGRDRVEALRVTAGTIAILYKMGQIHLQLGGTDAKAQE
jgi:GAF domain-containing protein